jgi:hypothetical protein
MDLDIDLSVAEGLDHGFSDRRPKTLANLPDKLDIRISGKDS